MMVNHLSVILQIYLQRSYALNKDPQGPNIALVNSNSKIFGFIQFKEIFEQFFGLINVR